MAVRTALLTSRNINLDTDFSKYIESVSTAGVITGFQVTASSVATGQAWVPCIRTNLETIYAFVQNYNSISISGNGYVIISIPQEIIDNGGGNEDGTGIATVEVVDTLPTKNYLLLATITGGVVEDNRYMIPKVDELKTDIDTINEQIHDLDVRVDRLENLDAIDHLEERALVGEKYALTDTLFKQLTPKLADCTVEANVGYDAATTEIHIQRQGSGTASNTLKLKLKKAGSPANLVVEVRKGVQVDVSSSEAYWYGDSEQVLATGSINASNVTTSWQELEVELDAAVGGTEGELLDIVLYQTASAVSSTNYYVMACDSTQWSEGFSYVKVNGTTRSREKLMPYCVSGGFAQALLVKVSSSTITGYGTYKNTITKKGKPTTTSQVNIINQTISDALESYKLGFKATTESGTGSSKNYTLVINNEQLWSKNIQDYENYETDFFTGPGTTGSTVRVTMQSNSMTYNYDMYFEYYAKGNITIKKDGNNGTPRSNLVINIGDKESITLIGVHSDNTWKGEDICIKNTVSSMLNYISTKGEKHTISPSNGINRYTMQGFGYIRYNSTSNNVSSYYHMPYLIIGNTYICNIVEGKSNYSVSAFEFLQPGDYIEYNYKSDFTNMELVEYY